MDQWSGVEQDEVTAGIGCQSVGGPRTTGLSGACHIIFIIEKSSRLLLREGKHRAVDRAGVARRRWTTNEMEGVTDR